MSSPRWKSICVVIVDPFRRTQQALDKAAAIAGRARVGLTLLNTFTFPQPTPQATLGSSAQIIRSAVAQRRARLQELAAPLRRRGIRVRVAVEWDFPPHEAIVRHVMQTRPDLLIAESHRHGRLARWILANTDWELIRACPCPLWFVRSATLPKAVRVLVAVDPRHTHAKPARLDERLLRAGAALAAQLGGHMEMVHTYESPAVGAGTIVEPVRLPLKSRRTGEFVAATRKRVDLLARRHAVAAEHTHLLEGETSSALSELAKRLRTDVLLLGAVSRSRLGQPVIGSTAERVIDQVPCDVFVVKPAGFKAPVSRRRPRID